jgi:hypothetical protein
MSSAHRLRRPPSLISRAPPRSRACRGSAGTPDGGGAAGAPQPFLPGLAIFFELEKGSNWLPQALIGQQLKELSDSEVLSLLQVPLHWRLLAGRLGQQSRASGTEGAGIFLSLHSGSSCLTDASTRPVDSIGAMVWYGMVRCPSYTLDRNRCDQVVAAGSGAG